MSCRHFGGARLPRDRTPLAGSRVIRRLYIRIGLNARRLVRRSSMLLQTLNHRACEVGAVTPDVPPVTTRSHYRLAARHFYRPITPQWYRIALDPVVILGLSGASPHQNGSA